MMKEDIAHNVLVIILFAVPVLIVALNQRNHKHFSLPHVTKIFNRAFIIHLTVGLLIVLASYIIDKKVYMHHEGNFYSDMFMYSVMAYVTIGIFFYLPALGLLNLINWLILKFKR